MDNISILKLFIVEIIKISLDNGYKKEFFVFGFLVMVYGNFLDFDEDDELFNCFDDFEDNIFGDGLWGVRFYFDDFGLLIF